MSKQATLAFGSVGNATRLVQWHGEKTHAVGRGHVSTPLHPVCRRETNSQQDRGTKQKAILWDIRIWGRYGGGGQVRFLPESRSFEKVAQIWV